MGSVRRDHLRQTRRHENKSTLPGIYYARREARYHRSGDGLRDAWSSNEAGQVEFQAPISPLIDAKMSQPAKKPKKIKHPTIMTSLTPLSLIASGSPPRLRTRSMEM